MATQQTTAGPNTMTVKAAPGVRVPIEGSPRKYITDSDQVTVERTAYYVRREKDGDLVRIDSPTTALTSKPASTASSTAPANSTAASSTSTSMVTRGVASEA